MTPEALDRPNRSQLLSDRDWTAENGRWGQALRSAGPDISSNAGPLFVRFGDAKLVLSEPPPLWAREPIRRICSLGELDHNWDSYGARQVDPRCAMVAVNLILSTMGPATPTPAVVPTNRGGIQLEWHNQGIDLEIEVLSQSRLRISFDDEGTGESREHIVLPEFQVVNTLIERISPTN